MDKKTKIIISIILTIIVYSRVSVFGQDATDELVINRPLVEYRSAKLRDPFSSYIINKEVGVVSKSSGTGEDSLAEEFNKLRVQGIIWGSNMPQAIIDSKVYSVGDKINNAEIINIDNKGVSLNTGVGIIVLSSPGLSKIPIDKK